MDPLVREITDFAAVQRYLDRHEGGFCELLKAYYAELGESLGLQSERDAFLEAFGAPLGALDVVWREEEKIHAAFALAFSHRDAFLAALFKVLAAAPETAVLVGSSRVRGFSLHDAQPLAEKSGLRRHARTLLLMDLSTETFRLV